MNATAHLHATGQSIWLDNISRKLLDSGTLARYINDLSVTGLGFVVALKQESKLAFPSNEWGQSLRSPLKV